MHGVPFYVDTDRECACQNRSLWHSYIRNGGPTTVGVGSVFQRVGYVHASVGKRRGDFKYALEQLQLTTIVAVGSIRSGLHEF